MKREAFFKNSWKKLMNLDVKMVHWECACYRDRHTTEIYIFEYALPFCTNNEVHIKTATEIANSSNIITTLFCMLDFICTFKFAKGFRVSISHFKPAKPNLHSIYRNINQRLCQLKLTQQKRFPTHQCKSSVLMLGKELNFKKLFWTLFS